MSEGSDSPGIEGQEGSVKNDKDTSSVIVHGTPDTPEERAEVGKFKAITGNPKAGNPRTETLNESFARNSAAIRAKQMADIRPLRELLDEADQLDKALGKGNTRSNALRAEVTRRRGGGL